ncbi:hypothetical protein Mgra_00004801 [Meloidogyne graminicola]|uniref:Uncharacterized protein n=1 Tax=Meloidogyne graminicola TaxID=189291 RepID=A0A8S9ZQ18_9BILA|nr:hypothetical protein Mgra_00004801 [Meloidogyne graminicola]
MIYKINCVILQWIILIWLIPKGGCSGQGSSEEIRTDEEAYVFDFADMMFDYEKPNTPEQFEELLNIATEKLKNDGILNFVRENLKNITTDTGKFIRYVRLIGPGSMVQHDDHAFYFKEAWNQFQNFSKKDKSIQYMRHQASSIYQSALMIEVVKYFDDLHRRTFGRRVKIEATIEDLHLDPNEIEYYKGRKDIKIEPIKVEMPKLNEWLQTNKTKQNTSLKKKQTTKGKASSSSSNTSKGKEKKVEEEETIWTANEWINWLENAPNNLNTIPKNYNEMKKNEVTLVMMFDCPVPMVSEVTKSYANLKGKPQLILINSGDYDYWKVDKNHAQNHNKLFGNIYRSFPDRKLSKFFGMKTLIYYKN